VTLWFSDTLVLLFLFRDLYCSTSLCLRSSGFAAFLGAPPLEVSEMPPLLRFLDFFSFLTGVILRRWLQPPVLWPVFGAGTFVVLFSSYFSY